MMYLSNNDEILALKSYEFLKSLDQDLAQKLYDFISEIERFEEEITTCKQAIMLDPSNDGLYNNLGLAHSRYGRYKEEAITAFKQAIKLNPNDAEAFYNLGISCLLNNDERTALKSYESLKNLDQDFAQRLYDSIYK